MESEITMDAAEAIAYGEGNKFVDGTGVGCPRGLTVDTDITGVTGSDTSTHYVTATDLIGVYGELKEAYRRNATFVMNRDTLTRCMKLTDDYGQYLWIPNMAQGPPDRILGIPFVLMTSIDDDGTASNVPVFCGDFRQGYYIIQRTGIEVTRDPFSSKPDIEFLFHLRIGGDVVKAEAIKKVTCG